MAQESRSRAVNLRDSLAFTFAKSSFRLGSNTLSIFMLLRNCFQIVLEREISISQFGPLLTDM